MLFFASLGVLFIPLILQYTLFKNTTIKSKTIYFLSFSILNLLLQIVVAIVSMILAVYAITEAGIKCATGAVGILFFGFILGTVLLAMIIIQYTKIKKYNEN